MSPRVTSGLLVSALIRRVEAAGGHGAVLSKGDPTSGAILLAIADRGRMVRMLERALGFDGGYHWTPAGPTDFDEPGVLGDYVARRRRSDPDIWVVELDAAEAERIAQEVLGG